MCRCRRRRLFCCHPLTARSLHINTNNLIFFGYQRHQHARTRSAFMTVVRVVNALCFFSLLPAAANFTFPSVAMELLHIHSACDSLSCVRCRKRRKKKCDEKRISWMWNKKQPCAGMGWVDVDDVSKLSHPAPLSLDTRQGWMLSRSCFSVCYCLCSSKLFPPIPTLSANHQREKKLSTNFLLNSNSKQIDMKIKFSKCWESLVLQQYSFFSRSSRVNFRREYFNIISRFVFICTRISHFASAPTPNPLCYCCLSFTSGAGDFMLENVYAFIIIIILFHETFYDIKFFTLNIQFPPTHPHISSVVVSASQFLVSLFFCFLYFSPESIGRKG